MASRPACTALVSSTTHQPVAGSKAKRILGEPAVTAGLMFLPMTALLSSANLTSAKVAARFGPRLTIWTGLAVSMLALLACTGPDRLLLTAVMVPAGLGLGFALPSLTVVLLDAIPADQAGLAAGMLNSSRQIGGTLAVAVFGVLISRRADFVAGLRGSILIGAVMLLAATAAALTLPVRPGAAAKMN